MSNKRIDLKEFEDLQHSWRTRSGIYDELFSDWIEGRKEEIMAELKRCYEKIDEINENGNCNCKVWVVEEESRHGIDINVFKYRPDITDYIRKKETPTEDAEWEDKYYGEDVRIDYDGPDGWEYRVGNNDYRWKCSKS